MQTTMESEEALYEFASLTRQARGRYKWDDFVVKPSGLTSELTMSARDRCDLGVYAARDLAAGVWVPITGRPVGSPAVFPSSREYCYQRSAPLQSVDGDPAYYAYGDVGCFGLAIAMMVNEPADAQTHANCMYKLDFLVTTADIKKGEQLLVDYGSSYPRKYAVDRTPSVRDLEADAHHEALKGRVPPVNDRRAVLAAVDKAVAFEVRKASSEPHVPTRPQAAPAPFQPLVPSRPTVGLAPRAAAAVRAGKYTYEQVRSANFISARRLPLSVNVYAHKTEFGIQKRHFHGDMQRALVPFSPPPHPPPPL